MPFPGGEISQITDLLKSQIFSNRRSQMADKNHRKAHEICIIIINLEGKNTPTEAPFKSV